jgi:hypothetical protein
LHFFPTEYLQIFLLCCSQVVAVFVVAMCAIALADDTKPAANPAAKSDSSVEKPKDASVDNTQQKPADAAAKKVSENAPKKKKKSSKSSKKSSKKSPKKTKKATDAPAV